LFDRSVGLWTALSLSVLYWHVHLSHLGLRAILQPFVGTLAFTMLILARRNNRSRYWIVGGILIGLLAYTYFAARLWIVLAVIILAIWLARGGQLRKGVLLAAIIAIVVGLPQLLFTARYPEIGLFRIGTVAVTKPGEVWQNAMAWGNALFGQGDSNAELNLSMRPIFDWALATPLLAGVPVALLAPERRRGLPWMIGLGVVSLSASLFSDGAPHFLRAIGLVIPLALVLGLGFDALQRILQPHFGTAAMVLPVAFILVSYFSARRDFNSWLQHDNVLTSMEVYVNEPANWIRRSVSADSDVSIFFSPIPTFHPEVAFQSFGLAPRHVGGFGSSQCLVIPEEPAYFVVIPAYAPEFESLIAPWARLGLRAESARKLGEVPLYRVYEIEAVSIESGLSPVAEAPLFNDKIRVRHSALQDSARPGETLEMWLAFQAQLPSATVVSAFVHLQGDPTPYEGGRLWAQHDSWLCESYPSTIWQPGETVLQKFSLDLPADLPEGEYEIAVGMHEAPAGPRLALTAPLPNPDNFYVIHRLLVEA
jgi:hypothetical protein